MVSHLGPSLRHGCPVPLGVPETHWILRRNPPSPLKLSQVVLRNQNQSQNFLQVRLAQNPNHHSLLIQDLLLGAEVKGLATFHHLPELLPQLPKLHLSQLLFFLLRRFLGSFGVFSPDLL